MPFRGILVAICLALATGAFAPGAARAQAVDQKTKACKDGKPDEVIAACTDLIKRGGKQAEAYYYNRSLGWSSKGDCDRALADAEQALALLRDEPNLIRPAVVWADCKKDKDRAVIHYSEAIRAFPKSAPAYYGRAVALHDKSEIEKSLADYNQAIRLNPKDPDYYYGRARVWGDQEEYDRAIADYSQALRLKPGYSDAYSYRGNAYADKGERAKAQSDHDTAIRLDPKNADHYDNRARAARLAGDLDRALADHDTAIRLSPASAVFHRTRGRTWQEKGDLDRALADLNEAVRLETGSAWARLARGVTLRYRGEFARAVADFDAVLKLYPNDATTYVERGRTYEKAGDPVRARADFEKALTAGGTIAKTAHEDARTQLAALKAAKPAQPAASSVPAVLPAATTATLPAAPAEAAGVRPDSERRVALVIGNSAYSNVPKLSNPASDARVVAGALRAIGFQAVTIGGDLTREKLADALRSFAAQAEGADWAVIYFAGHGIEVGGVNYLIPVDAKLSTDRDVQFEAVSLEQVMAAVEGAKKIKVVILDACRDNPFAQQMRRTVATRSIGRGLSRVEPEGASLVVYAAKHGQTALDGTGLNSPFAAALTKRIATPGIEITKLFRLVRDDVMDATGGRQEPFTYGSLPGREDFFFVMGK